MNVIEPALLHLIWSFIDGNTKLEENMDYRIYLKVKNKSLAAESKIIRKEEKRNPDFRSGLEHHRKTVVRSESRHTHLAYGFLRGLKRSRIEQRFRSEPNKAKVWKMVKKYNPYAFDLERKFDEWWADIA